MTEQRMINDNGIAALKSLAYKSPSLFIEADPDALANAMEEQGHTKDVWGNSFDLQGDISSLNDVQESGPITDAYFSRIVRSAFPKLGANQGLDEYRWATTNCFVIPKYVKCRWKHVQPSKSEQLPNYVPKALVRWG